MFSSVLSLSKDIIDGEPLEQDIAIEKESQSKLSRCLTLALLSLFIIFQVVIDARYCVLGMLGMHFHTIYHVVGGIQQLPAMSSSTVMNQNNCSYMY